MKQAIIMTKMMSMCVVALLAVIFFWPFAVAGITAFFVSGLKFNRWISSATAMVTVIIWRLSVHEWPMRIGPSVFTHWYMEVILGTVNWAFAAIFVSGFAHWPSMFIRGYRGKSSDAIENEDAP